MNSTQQDKFRRMLRDIADRAADIAASQENQVRTPTGGEAAGGISNAPIHLGDIGSEVYNQELGVTLMENETFIRDEALAALERIRLGRFGRCENCGEPIPIERLNAVPYTHYCAPCAEMIQSGRTVNFNEGRPPTWLGEPGHEGFDRMVGRETERVSRDVHATGTPGGGTAVGGLAGTNVGSGVPTGANLEDAMGSSNFDTTAEVDDEEEEQPEAFSGRSGGAVGGTPANKRASGGRLSAKRTSSTKAKTAKTRRTKPKPAKAKSTKRAAAKQVKKAQRKKPKK